MKDIILSDKQIPYIFPGLKMIYLKKCNPLYIVIIISLCFCIYPARALPENYNSWGTDKSTVIKGFPANTKYKEFLPKSDPKYENKIMNYVVAIDEGLAKNTTIIRTKTNPLRDYLFVKNKMYSIMEIYQSLSKDKINDIIKNLTADFGAPQIQQDKNMVIYTFSSTKTKVLVISYTNLKDISCRIYYYSSDLFKTLITQ